MPATPLPPEPTPTLYEWAGGTAAFERWLNAFYDLLETDAEWGSRLALHNSDPDAEVAASAPVPRWGWGVAPPYRP